MAYLVRECEAIEKQLLQVRTRLAAYAYDVWQEQRLRACDSQLGLFEAARADYEMLKRVYAASRDHHRALRLRLRRSYYQFLRGHDLPPNPATGIEHKVEALLGTPPDGHDISPLGQTLLSCHHARISESESAKLFCHADRKLREILEASRLLAENLLQRCLEAPQTEATESPGLALEH